MTTVVFLTLNLIKLYVAVSYQLCQFSQILVKALCVLRWETNPGTDQDWDTGCTPNFVTHLHRINMLQYVILTYYTRFSY